MPRILIVADVRLYRDGLAQALARVPEFQVLDSLGSLSLAVEVVLGLEPDVVLVDMASAGSHVLVREIATLAPATRVVALGIPEVDGDVIACAEAGIAGYVSRDASLEDLIAAIQRAGRGELLCSPKVAGSMLRHIAFLSAGRKGVFATDSLTGREREILRLIDQGCSNKDIARRLGIEVATVKNHVHNLLEKLQVHRRAEAAARLRAPAPWSSRRTVGS